jgi:hypothetical protein
MDFKTIILLAICAGAIYFIYKEFMSFKEEMKFNLVQMTKKIDLDMKDLHRNIQSDLTLCVNKIKNINIESIQNVIKMSRFEKQQITNKYANHFTDNDQDGDPEDFDVSDKQFNSKTVKTLVTNNNLQINVPLNNDKTDTSLYMSDKDDVPPKNTLLISPNNILTNILNNVMEGNILNPLDNKVIGNDMLVVVKYMDDNTDNTSSSSIQEKVELIVADNSESKNTQDKNISTHIPTKEMIQETKIEQKNDSTVEENKTNKNESVEQNSPKHAKKNSPSENMINKLLSEDDSDSSQNYDTLLDNITVGSKKKIKKEVKEPKDTSSVNTDNINTLNISNIQSIDNYNMEALKKMAKTYDIGLSAKQPDGKWKPLGKNELYNKIIEYLKQKKSNH